MTLENGVSVTRSLPSGGTQGHGWASSQALRFNVLPTDTTVSIGADISSTDEKWLRTLSAEQKLFGGPFSVTGSVSETPTGDMSKSRGPDSSERGDYLPQFLSVTGQRTETGGVRAYDLYRVGHPLTPTLSPREREFTALAATTSVNTAKSVRRNSRYARASGVLGPPSGLERRP